MDILHRIGVTSSADDVYAALTTVDGLAGWWTEGTDGDANVGGVFRVRFVGAPEPGGFDMKVLEAKPTELVLWEVVDGPQEWIGTHIRFELTQEDGFTIVLFRHEGWKEPVEFMYHCSTGETGPPHRTHPSWHGSRPRSNRRVPAGARHYQERWRTRADIRSHRGS